MKDKTGGPAFPSKCIVYNEGVKCTDYIFGMTLWDWYAAHALDSILSGDLSCDRTIKDMILSAADIVDAILKERDKRFK